MQVIADYIFESAELNADDTIYHEQCALLLEEHALVQQFVTGRGQYKYVPFKHGLEKVNVEPVSSQVVEQQHASLIVRTVVRDGNGAIQYTELGTSSTSDVQNEI